MRGGRAVAMGVAVVVIVAVGMGVIHGKVLYYNITEVHAGLSQLRNLATGSPEVCSKKSRPSQRRGRGEGRVRAAPAVSRADANKENAHEHTGSAEALRPSLRGGFTAYFALSPVNGLSCHRRSTI